MGDAGAQLGSCRSVLCGVSRPVRAWLLAIAVCGLAGVLLSVCASSASAASGIGNLSYGGGPVLHSSAPYLVFWTPAGESIPASPQRLVKRFLVDTAAESGKSSNAFGVLRQYHDTGGYADYRQTFNPARQVIVDTQPYPANDPAKCPAVSQSYPTCIGDAQIQAELNRLITTRHLPADGRWAAPELNSPAPIYFVILRADVDVCYTMAPLCTNDQIGGYHQSFVDAHNDYVLYAPLPLEPFRDGSVLFPNPKRLCQLDGTSAVQAPNGDVYGDALTNCLSHEYSETITDPLVNSGYKDRSTDNEVGDKCEGNTTAKLTPGLGY